MDCVKAVAQECVTEPGLLFLPQARQQLSEVKSHVQEGEQWGYKLSQVSLHPLRSGW